MAHTIMRGTGDIDMVTGEFISLMQRHAVSCELVDAVHRRMGTYAVHVLVFEKYYMRASNRVSLTATFISDGSEITADLIGSGGGQGALFRFSWGSEESFAGVAEKLLGRMGFWPG